MLKSLVPDIQKTSDLIQEISAASIEQNGGAEQINQAFQQLDSVIQHNASASEEMASTAEELSSQAQQLQNTIAFFKVDGEENLHRIQQAPKNGKQHHKLSGLDPNELEAALNSVVKNQLSEIRDKDNGTSKQLPGFNMLMKEPSLDDSEFDRY